MRILHLSLGIPELRTGGLVTYAYSLAKAECELGHECILLYPGNIDLVRKQTRIVHKKTDNGIRIDKIVNPTYVAVPLGVGNPDLILRQFDRRVFFEYLDCISPDLVHIHTFMGFPKELFDAIYEKQIRTLYTTHDYYPICAQTSMLCENAVCTGNNAEKCARCNATAPSSMKLQAILQSEWYPRIKRSKIVSILKKRRKNTRRNDADKERGVVAENITQEKIEKYQQLLNYYKEILDRVDIIHCNSTVTEMVYRTAIGSKKHFVLGISTDGIEDHRKEKVLPKNNSRKIKIGYIGIRDYHKGSWLLAGASKLLADQHDNFQALFYGDEFGFSKEDYPYCQERGVFAHNQLSQIMQELDILVVPGFWYETFGFSALEAVANNVSVLVSSHTGSKDILESVSTPHVFEPTIEDLTRMLELYLNDPTLLQKSLLEQNKVHLITSTKAHADMLLKKVEEFQ